LPVIVIGPVNAGKSTIASLLAARLGIGQVSLDDVCWEYFPRAGYDAEIAREHFRRGGQMGALAYMVQFYPAAVEEVVAHYPQSVIDFGAGHSVYDDPLQRARVKRALAGCRNVVLLLPSPDPEESLQLLNARQGNPHPEVVAMNEHFVHSSSNRELATTIVYTKGKSPEQTRDEVLSRLTP
jgi:predicted kinase